jgi:uncharacterized protein (DUF305 family)
MDTSPRRAHAAALLAAVIVGAACAAARLPAATAEGPRAAWEATGGPRARLAAADTAPRYTEADVRFMQHMIHHHAQALAMTSLVSARTSNQSIRTLAERITVSQQGEIGLMRQWLEKRHEPVPSVPELDPRHGQPGGADSAGHAMAGHGMAGHGMAGHAMASQDSSGQAGALMPGMLTPQAMAQLAAAKGAEFDRLFLQYMIRHHEGALTMVRQFFATPGAGQEPEIFRFASDVDADQRAEIGRMRTIQRAAPDDTSHR